TIGIGYFGSSVKNEPISGEFNLDKTFKRSGKTGPEIFVLGFKNPSSWKADIISKILESFISAIIFEDLEVVVDDVLLNKENLGNIVYDEGLINKPSRKSVISQYLLLTDVEHRFEDTIDFKGLGQAKLYLMEFNSENEHLATNGCVMIRYPLMKIRDIEKITTLPCSAMCIIEDNKLNAMLRNIENPQHTNWEFNRIEEDAKRAEVRSIYKQLLDEIRTIISGHLISSDSFQTEVAGAGNFIPGDDEEKNGDLQKGILDTPSITTKKVKSTELKLKAYVADENGDEEIEIEERIRKELEEHQRKTGNNSKPGTGDRREGHFGTARSTIKVSELKGMSYRLMCINKKLRMYAIVFTSDFEERDVMLELYALDDSGAKTQVLILAGTINGEQAHIINRKRIQFSIRKNQKIKIEMITDQTELFSSEVRVYACR
ncbi:MAG: hypothetical protein K2K50_06590, partial [Anaeroplasmataceae bacterium]|nr:hypothetical protein [Anaeroplasmataceae bacterium]